MYKLCMIIWAMMSVLVLSLVSPAIANNQP